MNWDITDWHYSDSEGWHADLVCGDGVRDHIFVRDKEVWRILFLIRYKNKESDPEREFYDNGGVAQNGGSV